MSRYIKRPLRRSTKILVGFFILLFGVLPAVSIATDRSFVDTTPSQMIVAGLAVAAVMILPAATYLAGLRWSRGVFGSFVVFMLVLWTPSPLAQHAIDRHLVFWGFWAAVEVFLFVLVWSVFTGPKKEPNQSTQRNAGSRPSSDDSSVSESSSSLGPRG